MSRIITFELSVEVPDEEDDKSLDKTLSDLEDYLANHNYDIYEVGWSDE